MQLAAARFHERRRDDVRAAAALDVALRLAERADRSPTVATSRQLEAQSDEPSAPLEARTAGHAPPPATADPASLDRERGLRAEIEADLSLRQREGEAGLGRLGILAARASASVPIGYALRLWVRAEPTLLDLGAGALDDASADRSGSLGLTPGAVASSLGPSPRGASLSVGMVHRGLELDVGTTPLGFDVETFVAGLRYAGRIGRVDYVADLSRRPITDSALSFAGLRDPGTGQVVGGVLRQGGRLDLALRTGGPVVRAHAGGWLLDGTRVVANGRWSAGLGYFSPQLFVRAGAPLRWRASAGDVVWRVGVDPGVNAFRADAEDWFPGAPDRQAAREALSATGRPSRHPRSERLGFGLDAEGGLALKLDASLEVGAGVELHFASDYQEVAGVLSVRHAFSSASAHARRTAEVDR